MLQDTLAEKAIDTSDDGIVEAQPPPPPAVAPIPDGGLQAWLQVLGAHFLFFNSWGVVNTFGAFQAYYESDLLQQRPSSDISWIGTFQGFLLIVFGIVGGPVLDQGYLRSLLLIGTFLVVFGMMMTSLATQYWQLFLAQGICVGFGCGCIFLPSIAIVATYFSKKRALATGITAAGGSIGSVIYPILFRRLQPKIGFPWATRIIGFIALATLAISLLTMKTRLPPPKKSRRIIDTAAFRSPSFVLFGAGLFLVFVGLYIPFFYIIVYAELKVHINDDISFYLLAITNASSVFGRIIPGLLADKLGALEVLIFCAITSGILAYSWIAVHSLAGLVIFSILYGFFSGAVVSLPSTVIASFVPELRLVGTWMGMSFCFAGLGLLIGNPIAGTVIKVSEAKFTGGQIFGATTVMAGSIIFVGVGALKFFERRKAGTKGGPRN